MIEIGENQFKEEESSFLQDEEDAELEKILAMGKLEDSFTSATSHALSSTVEFFSHDTPLKKASEYGGRPYEFRKQQVDMALAVAASFEDGKNLCVEAPTGVGKSFAYLVPAIYHAMSVHRPVIVTTETITLQEQLIRKDLPLLQELTNLNFTYAIAVGRGNYLCRKRLALASGERKDEFLPSSMFEEDIDKLVLWGDSSSSGFYGDLPFPVERNIWNIVCSEGTSCTGPACRFFRSCFYWNARKEWDKADVLVTNHALFFVDLKIRAVEELESTPLPNHSAIIFDEGQSLEDNAAKHLGMYVASNQVKGFLNRLYNPKNGRGLLVRPGENSLILRTTVDRLHDLATVFFDQFAIVLENTPDKCLRVRHPGRFEDTLTEDLADLERRLKDYAADQEEEGQKDFAGEVLAQVERSIALRESIRDFITMGQKDTVYWMEEKKSPVSGNIIIELYSAPLKVAELLNKLLFSRPIPAIITSATLAVNGSLEYFCKRTGFANGDTLLLDSPFDYEKQVKLYLGKNMPQPSDPEYNQSASSAIKEFINFTAGRAFVLFTNYSMLRKCAEYLEEYFRHSPWKFFRHGDSLGRTKMIEEFKKCGNGVIFGASSFWTGVDVPGEALSNVIITKLPFAVPSHPLTEARCELIRQQGGRAFEDYSIPNAVLMFRQGAGRLIRSKSDTGIIVVLDPRIVTKYYGRLFLNSLPKCPVTYF